MQAAWCREVLIRIHQESSDRQLSVEWSCWQALTQVSLDARDCDRLTHSKQDSAANGSLAKLMTELGHQQQQLALVQVFGLSSNSKESGSSWRLVSQQTN